MDNGLVLQALRMMPVVVTPTFDGNHQSLGRLDAVYGKRI
jgi:hypothetical protein